MEIEEQQTKPIGKGRLWIVTELYYPEETSTGYYLTRLAEHLIDDFEVKAICGQPNYSRRGTRAPKREFHKNVEIFRASSTTLDKNVIFFRLVNMATLGITILILSLRHFRRGDRVLVVTTPPVLPFMAAAASLFRGSAYTLLIHDNYPEILVAVGKAKAGSLFVSLADRFNRWLFKYAAKIIVVGRDMVDLVARKSDGLDVPIVYIPNWAELETVEPLARAQNPLLKELGLNDKFVFLYAGNMGFPNDIESIVECADRMQTDKRIHFIFLGNGVKRKWLSKEVEKRRLSNVTLLDPRPRSDQIQFLNACDVGLVSLVDRMKGVSMPSRTYNILAAGKPILAVTEPESELSLVISETNAGFVVPPDHPDQLVQTIGRFLRMDAIEISEMGERARNAAVTRYSIDVAVESYRSALKGY